jgi:acyl-homoserine lactone acylase PvdQ
MKGTNHEIILLKRIYCLLSSSSWLPTATTNLHRMEKAMIKKAFGVSSLVIFLALVATSVLAKNHEATIKRDNYGVPHIYSHTLEGLYFGYGYALAQDRLFQIEILRRTYWGRLSEIYGEELLAFDQSNRRPRGKKSAQIFCCRHKCLHHGSPG